MNTTAMDLVEDEWEPICECTILITQPSNSSSTLGRCVGFRKYLRAKPLGTSFARAASSFSVWVVVRPKLVYILFFFRSQGSWNIEYVGVVVGVL